MTKSSQCGSLFLGGTMKKLIEITTGLTFAALLASCGHDVTLLNHIDSKVRKIETNIADSRDWFLSKQQPQELPPSDAEFDQYKMSFSAAGDIEPFTVPIVFEPLYGILGRCLKYSNGNRLIQIDPSYWTELNDSERKVLIYHELGHCVLGRPHSDKRELNIPLSMMNWALLDFSKYEEFSQEYELELFERNEDDLRNSIRTKYGNL